MSGRRIAALGAAGLTLLVLGAVLYGLAFLFALAAGLDEHAGEGGWMSPLAWTGIALMIAGPTIFWLIVPLAHRLRSR